MTIQEKQALINLAIANKWNINKYLASGIKYTNKLGIKKTLELTQLELHTLLATNGRTYKRDVAI
jgi:hypothetical protein